MSETESEVIRPEHRKIISGSSMDVLPKFESNSIDVVITSPPYWAQRNYGDYYSQLGIETKFQDYLNRLRTIMKELHRVLKSDGSVWIVIGDKYNSGSSADHGINSGFKSILYGRQSVSRKSLIGLPERFFVNCLDDGWIGRNHVIWRKTNPKPESIKDRLSSVHESIFFLTKSDRYHFDLDKIRIPNKSPSVFKHTQDNSIQTKLIDGGRNYKIGKGIQNMHKHGVKGHNTKSGKSINHPLGKNPGNVLDMPVDSIHEYHFATFPVELPLTILRAACPENGIVLDPFFGTGTTAIAAEKLGMRWTGIEILDEYIAMAKRRLWKYGNMKICPDV